ncbi:hypothetical protein UJ101_00335 [Flavobacteriaceae bacterium UJ101]|nr:hypothetical protein UJ101_00335 [Flavobacteriaceae bacterium UJ101]
MNTFKGTIQSIETNGSLSLVKIEVQTLIFSTVVIETPHTAPYLKKGTTIHILFKETEVVIGKNTDHLVSMQNKVQGEISKIEKGALLSKLILHTAIGELTAIITSNAIEQLNLQEGEHVVAMIKTNEIMLSK